jgi:hypothetical protein
MPFATWKAARRTQRRGPAVSTGKIVAREARGEVPLLPLAYTANEADPR